MHLYRKLGAWFHCDTFYLVALAVVDGVVNAPGTVNFPVIHMLMSAIAFNALDDLFNVLNFVFMGDQQSIFGFDNDQVLNPDRCDQSALRPHQGTLGIVSDDVAAKAVSVGVFL